MPLCALAKLDADSERKIKEIKKRLCTKGVACDIVPAHITLGVYENLEPAKLQEWTKAFSAHQEKVMVEFTHVGFFSASICFLAPLVNWNLLHLHKVYHGKFEEHCKGLGKNYSLQNGKWVPHCTLFIGEKQDVEKTMPLLTELFQPFSATIEGIVVGYFANEAKTYTENSIIEEFYFK